MKWKPRNDRITRRKLVVHSNYSKGKDTEDKQNYKIQRQRSTNSETVMDKRQRLNDTSKSGMSQSDDDC